VRGERDGHNNRCRWRGRKCRGGDGGRGGAMRLERVVGGGRGGYKEGGYKMRGEQVE